MKEFDLEKALDMAKHISRDEYLKFKDEQLSYITELNSDKKTELMIIRLLEKHFHALRRLAEYDSI